MNACDEEYIQALLIALVLAVLIVAAGWYALNNEPVEPEKQPVHLPVP